MLRDLFTQEDWEILEVSILWMFQSIAGADKKIDIHELDAMTFVQENAHKFESELIKEVLSSVKYDIDDITNLFTIDNSGIKTGLRNMADILEDKVSEEEALLFKKSILSVGMYIAFASGDILSSKMSNVENQTLIELSLYMKIPNSKFREEPTVQQLMNKLVS